MIFYNETFSSCHPIPSEKYLFQTARAERLVNYLGQQLQLVCHNMLSCVPPVPPPPLPYYKLQVREVRRLELVNWAVSIPPSLLTIPSVWGPLCQIFLLGVRLTIAGSHLKVSPGLAEIGWEWVRWWDWRPVTGWVSSSCSNIRQCCLQRTNFISYTN